ncbi:FG-GAP-like repeat-containing protein [Actinomadura rupiterrae]|uniref:FG-GAP-like repeat-containing protein n=1 Tax=Actinomadura rupiterrae TaxID=559627 RepID=UPI0020A2EC96|nr:FG-GAP-like repeat-containing protein [Actinomadura rupiterrae]MCP2338039.1 hypothetical protein [Actinomadura rupiterrae]
MRTRGSALLAVAMVGASGLAAVALAGPAEAQARRAQPFDFNGDGRCDVALGSPDGTVGGKRSAGFVTIVSGAKGGPNASRRVVLSQDAKGVPGAARPGDRFGASLASADFDRDGYADLAVGAPGDDARAGSVTIFWGSRSGLTGRATLRTEARRAPGHRFGESLATGDIEGDGNPELFVTVPGTSTFTWLYFTPRTRTTTATAAPSTSAQGASAVGSTSAQGAADVDRSWVASGDINGDGRGDVVYAWFDGDDPTVEHRRGFTVFNGTARGGFTRGTTVYTTVHALAVADFNGDRRADIAVGDMDDRPSAGGRVSVFTSGFLGLDRPYSIARPGGGTAEDDFGASLASGDVNGDGRADLAVGAPKTDIGRTFDAGTAYVLFGTPSGLSARGARHVTLDSPGVPGTARGYDYLGAEVALLDANGDGRADLIAGAPGFDRDNGAALYIPAAAARASGTSGLATSGAIGLTARPLGVQGRGAELGTTLGH